ncbi:hypothetical protein J3A83DRAFT_4359968 [Scleroderma citrinum]
MILTGFNVPGLKEKLIMSLYMDNTTVYLSESNFYDTLQTILSKWCITSGTKFNLEKMEIIPIGSEEHHEREPILKKLKSALKRWNKSHPSLDAKYHIVQMMAGGMTQFLTVAQGMPRHIETVLISIIQDFIWESSAPQMISMERLYAPLDKEGINLLNIHARNKAIDIIRLKTYLNLSSRPKWAFLIDHNCPHDFTWVPPSRAYNKLKTNV